MLYIRLLLWSLCSVSGISDSKLNTNVLTEFVTSAVAHITYETLPGLLRAFCTACDKSCVWRPGNEANIAPHVTENLQPYYMYTVSRENLRAFPLSTSVQYITANTSSTYRITLRILYISSHDLLQQLLLEGVH